MRRWFLRGDCSTIRLLSFASNSPNLIVVILSWWLICYRCIRVQVTLFLQILERFRASIGQVHLLSRSEGLLSLVHHGVGCAGLGRNEACEELLLLGLTIIRRWGSGLQWSKLAVRLSLRHDSVLGAEHLVGLVLVLLRHLLIWMSTIIRVALSRAITAERIARGYKLSQVAVSIFSCISARYIVFQS